MSSKYQPAEYYQEDLKQNWNRNTYSKCISDQYGFVIEYGIHYTLSHRGVEIYRFNNLAAAKEAARVILNDKINALTIADVPKSAAREVTAEYSNTGHIKLLKDLTN